MEEFLPQDSLHFFPLAPFHEGGVKCEQRPVALAAFQEGTQILSKATKPSLRAAIHKDTRIFIPRMLCGDIYCKGHLWSLRIDFSSHCRNKGNRFPKAFQQAPVCIRNISCNPQLRLCQLGCLFYITFSPCTVDSLSTSDCLYQPSPLFLYRLGS